jgi:hypothetical protein
MFALIVLERAVDGLVLAFIGVGLLALGYIPSTVEVAVLTATLLLVALAAALTILLIALYNQHPVLLKFWHYTTALFNDHIKNSLRFKLWTVIYGLQKLFNRRALAVYIAAHSACGSAISGP